MRLIPLLICAFIACIQTAHSQTTVTYDFESLTVGSSIHGQDNWVVQSSFSTVNNGNVCPPAAGTAAPPNIINSTGSGSYTGSQALTANGKGNQHAFSSRVDDGNWGVPNLTGAVGIIVEADWSGNWWGKNFRLAYDSNNDGDFSSTCTALDANEASFGFSTSQGNLRLHGANGAIVATGTRPSEWCRIRLCIDVTANSGQGAGSLFYLDHTSSGSWVAHSISNVNMGFNTGATNQTNYQNINGILYDQEAGGASIFDNVSIDVYYANFPGCVTALPVDLTSFSAEENDNHTVDLNWTTITERDNDYFTVERSVDGFTWEEILTVDGAGTSETELHYNTIDPEPYLGASFYRLKQTDYNGDFMYANTETVFFEEDHSISITPNPTEGDFSISFGEHEEPIEVSITDISGKLIQNLVFYNEETANIHVDGAPGAYFITVFSGDKRIVKRIIRK